MKIRKISIFFIFFVGFLFACNYLYSESISGGYQKNLTNIPVRIIRQFSIPRGYHEGIFFDGKNIWIANGKGIDTWVIDRRDGSVVAHIESVSSFTEGMTSGGNNTLWITDWEDKALYHTDMNEKKFNVLNKISLAPEYPTGVILVHNKLYVITWLRNAVSTKYYLNEIDENGVLLKKMRIKGINEPCHLAWDGTHLWVTSWSGQLIYKIDLGTFTVKGAFQSPVPDTTGISWDGKYFWVTGTNSDLFQLEIK